MVQVKSHVASLSIGEVSARAGVPASTIRYYERIGLLSPPERQRGRRRYSAEVIESLALVRLGRSLGFSLSQLQELASSERRKEAPGQWPAIFRERLEDIRATMIRLRGAERVLVGALGCGCEDMTTCDRLAITLKAGHPKRSRPRGAS